MQRGVLVAPYDHRQLILALLPFPTAKGAQDSNAALDSTVGKENSMPYGGGITGVQHPTTAQPSNRPFLQRPR